MLLICFLKSSISLAKDNLLSPWGLIQEMSCLGDLASWAEAQTSIHSFIHATNKERGVGGLPGAWRQGVAASQLVFTVSRETPNWQGKLWNHNQSLWERPLCLKAKN